MALVAGRDMAQPWGHAGRGCSPWDKHNTGKPSLEVKHRSGVPCPCPPQQLQVCRAGLGCAPGLLGQRDKPSKSCIGV